MERSKNHEEETEESDDSQNSVEDEEETATHVALTAQDSAILAEERDG